MNYSQKVKYNIKDTLPVCLHTSFMEREGGKERIGRRRWKKLDGWRGRIGVESVETKERELETW